jgi:hypothetical protein
MTKTEQGAPDFSLTQASIIRGVGNVYSECFRFDFRGRIYYFRDEKKGLVRWKKSHDSEYPLTPSF